MAAATDEPGSWLAAEVIGSRIARFANEIRDFGQTGFRDDGGDVLERRLNLAPMEIYPGLRARSVSGVHVPDQPQ